MSPFTRPETVIRRADELLSVDQPLAALSSLSEVFSSKRFRTTPLSVLEPILIKFLGLCVQLRKGRTAKEGLHMYKNVAQNLSVGSVEVVVKVFLAEAKAKLDEALASVATEVGAGGAGGEEGVEDLEASETPESILLGAVSDEDVRDRNYRSVVTPWLRFLWEAYRTALDTLRNNARLEVLYQTVSNEAFAFCLLHSRKTEFRRLSETLRSHLLSSQKYSHQTHSINLSDPETLQRHLETRFNQLNTAVELELWQEAFRTSEDIHSLIGMSKKVPRKEVMVGFYERMVEVFRVGGNGLFHAAAYGKLLGVVEKEQGDKLASVVLLSALSVKVSGGEEEEGKGRLMGLLGLERMPTRSGLIEDALNRHILKRVSKELQSLYQILETDFHPLSITSKISPILLALSQDPETARYVEPLKEVVLARLFQQLAQVYSEVKIERIVKLATFDGEGNETEATRRRVEKFVTESCRKGDLQVRIDHRSDSIKFDQDLFTTSSSDNVASTSKEELKSLQPSSSTLLRTHLTRLAQTLTNSLNTLSLPSSPLSLSALTRSTAFAALTTSCAEERATLLSRTQIIKRRKELADEQTARKEKEEILQRTARAQQIKEEEEKRLKDEVKRKEMEKIKKDLAEDRKREMDKALKALLERTGQPAPVLAEEELSSEKIFQLGVQHIEREKRDLAKKLSGVSKRMDHLERAFRKEEIPLLKQDYERQQARDKNLHMSSHSNRIASLKAQHSSDLAIKNRLTSILPDYHQYRTRVELESKTEWEKKNNVLKEQLEEAKAARREEVLAKRAKEAEARAKKEALEAEQRARDEEVAREIAEAEAREAEEKAAIEERQRKLAQEAEDKRAAALAARAAERAADLEKIRQQQQREDEALAKRQNGIRPPAPRVGGPPAVGSAEWRAQRDSAATPAPSSGERPRVIVAPRTIPTPPIAVAAAPTATPISVAAAPASTEPKKMTWREREAAAAKAGGGSATPPAASTPPPTTSRPSGTWSSRRDAPPSDVASTPKGDDEGFQAQKKAYRPPGAREGGGSRW